MAEVANITHQVMWPSAAYENPDDSNALELHHGKKESGDVSGSFLIKREGPRRIIPPTRNEHRIETTKIHRETP